MAATNFDFLGQDDWRKRIYQLKQELRSSKVEPRLNVPEEGKRYGSAQKAQRRTVSTTINRVVAGSD